MTAAPAAAPWRRVAILAFAVLAATAALTFGPVSSMGPFGALSVPWLALLVAFAACEVFLIHIEHRREAVSLSLSTIPLVVGLYTVDPVALVAARVIGSGIALVVHRRQAPLKLAVNLGHMGLEAVVAILVFRALAPGGELGPASWPAAVAAALASDLVQSAVLVTAISLYQRRWEGALTETMALGTAARLVDTAVALVVVSVLRAEPAAVALLGLAGFALVWSYRAHTALRVQHRQLEHLYDFTQVMGDAVLAERTVEALLRQACDLLHSDAAWVYVERGGKTHRVGTTVEGALTLAEVAPGSPDALVEEGVRGRSRPELITATATPALAALGVAEALAAELRSGTTAVGTLVVADRSGEVRAFDDEDLRLFAMLANHAGMALANSQLVDRLRMNADESEYQSLHDSLTDLPNRAHFSRRLEERLAAGSALGVLLLDLDGFKDVNDTLGHQHGDLLLQQVAKRLRTALRHGDTLARLGGDEFAVLLPDVVGSQAAVSVARGLVAALERPFDVSDVSVEIGGSVGVALSPLHGMEADGLLQRADIAMYLAKANHTGVEVYDAERDGHTPERLALVGELRHAIAEGHLEVHYQPQMSLATGDVVGAEALVRWQHPTRGWLPPDEFVAVAERTGLVRPLTSFVLETALRECARWREGDGPERISVNLSARSLLQPTFPDDVRTLLRDTGVPAEALCLELTETSILVEPRRTVPVLQQLAQTGITIAIDDFGTGQSSLAYLKQLPVGEIKIDKSFVMTMEEDRADEAIVCSIIQLAANLDLPVVAEGVESMALAARLRGAGCGFAQGFGFSKALPAESFVAWVEEWRKRPGVGELRVVG
ncbi:MAG TPA: bifunctional diguanylate cyclase/phosphodiesterase [Acidimicrobiales bacterium]|nr:bifunctional diguanylate cyclase/phosphodiesterase [Acidimicrobiales bacterium]